jgi:enoyl-CoA hydratase
MAGRIDIEKADGIALLRFVNPPDGLMDDGTEAAFAPALDAVEEDPAIRVVILTGGTPGVFIRHFDVGLLERRGRALAQRGLTFSLSRPVPETPVHVAFRRIEDSPKPYLCALNGTAMGGGFEIALCCDLRLAEDGPYSLGLPEVNAGLLPGAGGTQRLTRLVGIARALELILRGKTVSPAQAAALGLVHEVTAGPVLPRAQEIARELATKSPRALAHIKRLVRGALDVPLSEGLAQERTLFCDLLVTPDSIERMAAVASGKRDIRQRT